MRPIARLQPKKTFPETKKTFPETKKTFPKIDFAEKQKKARSGLRREASNEGGFRSGHFLNQEREALTKLKKRSLEGAIDHDEQKEGDRDQKQPDFTEEEE